MDSDQSAILTLLRARGPLTVSQIADAIYPNGTGFMEDCGLSAGDKIDLELSRLQYSVEEIGRDDEGEGIYSATTPERYAELRKIARCDMAQWLRDVRSKMRRKARDTDQDLYNEIDYHLYRATLSERRHIMRASKRPVGEMVAEFNAKGLRCINDIEREKGTL